jgi:protein-S-isoprenylcysteine O-methyltransferase Ste14
MANKVGIMSSSPDTAGVLAPPPILFAIAFGLAMLLHWIHPLAIALRSLRMEWTGTILINISGLLALWATVYMIRARTRINPLRPTTALVIAGPYRFSRNPMSVSLVILFVGLALRLDTLWPLLLLLPLLIVYHYGVVQREEKYLERKFGDTYRNYRSAVRRWI